MCNTNQNGLQPKKSFTRTLTGALKKLFWIWKKLILLLLPSILKSLFNVF